MKKFLFLLAFVFSTSFLSAELIQINQMEDILPAIDSTNTLILIDMDDTLTDSAISLGSGPWRKNLRQYTGESKEYLHDLLTLFVACKVPVIPVEMSISTIIQDLQCRGFPVFVFTARGSTLWYTTPFNHIDALTNAQLLSIGLDFRQTCVPEALQWMGPDFYRDGVIYTSSTEKGQFLKSLLKTTGYFPSKIVFVDDKKSQVESVIKAGSDLGIPVAGFWYTRAEKNHRGFNPSIAMAQLLELLNSGIVLSDEEALKNALNDVDFSFEHLFSELDACKIKSSCELLLSSRESHQKLLGSL